MRKTLAIAALLLFGLSLYSAKHSNAAVNGPVPPPVCPAQCPPPSR